MNAFSISAFYRHLCIMLFSHFQWKEVSIEQLMDSKLKCVFEMPSSSGEKTVSIIFIHNLDILILVPQLFFLP